jgi:hypothetical protein
MSGASQSTAPGTAGYQKRWSAPRSAMVAERGNGDSGFVIELRDMGLLRAACLFPWVMWFAA